MSFAKFEVNLKQSKWIKWLGLVIELQLFDLGQKLVLLFVQKFKYFNFIIKSECLSCKQVHLWTTHGNSIVTKLVWEDESNFSLHCIRSHKLYKTSFIKAQLFENHRKSLIFKHCTRTSYVYILKVQKFIKNAKSGPFRRVLENLKLEVK